MSISLYIVHSSLDFPRSLVRSEGRKTLLQRFDLYGEGEKQKTQPKLSNVIRDKGEASREDQYVLIEREKVNRSLDLKMVQNLVSIIRLTEGFRQPLIKDSPRFYHKVRMSDLKRIGLINNLRANSIRMTPSPLIRQVTTITSNLIPKRKTTGRRWTKIENREYNLTI